MPLKLKPGSSDKTVGKNIAKIHHDPLYEKTKAKHGADVANQQAIAIAIKKKRGELCDRTIRTRYGAIRLRRLSA